MLPSRGSLLTLVTLSIALLLSSIPAFGRRAVGTRASSSYGSAGDQSFWELQPTNQGTVNGITISTEAVCPGGVDNSVSPSICNADYVFLYQIPTGPDNLVITFTGLSKFAFNDSGFGVLLCDPSPDNNMLCTQTLTTQDVDALNIGWDAIGGDLVLTIPSLPAGDTLTLFIDEGSESRGPLFAPTINIGGLLVIPSALTFGSQESGTVSTPQTVTVANSADFSSTLSLTNISPVPDFVSVNACSALTAGQNCAVFVSFSPSVPGTRSGILNLTDDSPVTTEVMNVKGTGNATGVTLSQSTAMFGSQSVGSSSSPLTVIVSNSASNSQALQISGIVVSANPVSGQPDFTETNTCNSPIAPGSSCQIQVTFTPTISGILGSSLEISDNSSDGSHTIQLSGNGTEQKTATVTPSSLSFGSQSSGSIGAPQTVLATNASLTAMTVVAVNATAGFGISSDNCSNAGPLAVGANCSVSVAFNPAQAGSYTGTLTIANDASGGTLVLPLTGSAVDFTLSSSADSNSVNQGGSASYPLTLASLGGFTGAIQLSCSGTPAESTCTVTPISINLSDSSPGQATLSVTTTAASSGMLIRPLYGITKQPGPFALLMLISIWISTGFLWRNRSGKWIPSCVSLGCSLTLIAVFASCGGGSSDNNTHHDLGTPKGSYTLTVSAVGGGLTHSASVKLVVQ